MYVAYPNQISTYTTDLLRVKRDMSQEIQHQNHKDKMSPHDHVVNTDERKLFDTFLLIMQG